MSREALSTAPKPFVFVLMPFNPEFKNIYTFGIKGAAEDVGVYAERVDEQLFTKGILDQIYNQINKADVIVADMTGQNPNVFYEVGYAHALDKIVVLLTKDADDIPFDLKHRPHIVYKGDIEKLREKLGKMLAWAVRESVKRGKQTASERYEVSILGIDIPAGASLENAPIIEVETKDRVLLANRFHLQLFVRNNSADISPAINYLYLFASSNNKIVVGSIKTPSGQLSVAYFEAFQPFKARPFDAYDGLSSQYRLAASIPPLPAGAVEDFPITFHYDVKESIPTDDQLFRFRIHSINNTYDFPFKIKLIKNNLPPTKD